MQDSGVPAVNVWQLPHPPVTGHGNVNLQNHPHALTQLCLVLSHQKAGKAASKYSASDDEENQQNSSGKEAGQLHR